jgi:hypothetical protein
MTGSKVIATCERMRKELSIPPFFHRVAVTIPLDVVVEPPGTDTANQRPLSMTPSSHVTTRYCRDLSAVPCRSFVLVW